MAEAELGRFIDRLTMEFVRVYPHPIERVWRAIIEPAEFGQWFIKGRLDPRVGGRYWFGDDGFQGEVQAIEPPRLLRLADDSAGQVFQYDLAEVTGGTRLQFTYRFGPDHGYAAPDPSDEAAWDNGGDLPGGPGTPWRPGFLGGWHDFWDRLAEHLDGAPIGSRLPSTEFSRFVKKWATESGGSVPFTPEQLQQRDRVYRSLRGRERWFELIRLYRDHIKATIPPA
jgi:uncharacterized protein YndB with AHSA1/START domain